MVDRKIFKSGTSGGQKSLFVVGLKYKYVGGLKSHYVRVRNPNFYQVFFGSKSFIRGYSLSFQPCWFCTQCGKCGAHLKEVLHEVQSPNLQEVQNPDFYDAFLSLNSEYVGGFSKSLWVGDIFSIFVLKIQIRRRRFFTLTRASLAQAVLKAANI